MVGHINLEEQVDRDFCLSRRKALRGRIGARLGRGDAVPNQLPCFDEVRKIPGAVGRVYRGMMTVALGQIRGSVGRRSGFDLGFMPVRASVEERWKRIDRAFHRGEELPPVSLYKLGDSYFVMDGHHRVSVARYHGVEWIDAVVAEFLTQVPVRRSGVDDAVSRGTRGSGARAMTDPYEVIWQHREELAREVQQNRLTRELRADRRKRAGIGGRGSTLIWELKRIIGRLSKLLGSSKDTD